MPLTKKDIDFLEMFHDDVFFTRDKNGRLFLSIHIPNINESLGEWEADLETKDSEFFELDKESLKAVTWESQKAWTPRELLALAD